MSPFSPLSDTKLQAKLYQHVEVSNPKLLGMIDNSMTGFPRVMDRIVASITAGVSPIRIRSKSYNNRSTFNQSTAP